MIPVIDFSWQALRVEKKINAKVQDLYTLAGEYMSDLFVFHDPENGPPALVISDMVIQFINELNVEKNQPLRDIGLMDILRRDQMVVSAAQPASLVAKSALYSGIDTVIAVDNDLTPKGLFIPSRVEKVLHTTLANHGLDHLSPLILSHINQGDLGSALKEIERVRQNFHSEKFNDHDPDPLVCSAFGQSHTTSLCPCTRTGHGGRSCGPRKIARQ